MGKKEHHIAQSGTPSALGKKQNRALKFRFLMKPQLIAYGGIGLIILSFAALLLPESLNLARKLAFSASMCLGSLLVLVSIALSGRVPLRGHGPWPHFRERFFTAAFGLVIYLALFIAMMCHIVITLMEQTGK